MAAPVDKGTADERYRTEGGKRFPRGRDLTFRVLLPLIAHRVRSPADTLESRGTQATIRQKRRSPLGVSSCLLLLLLVSALILAGCTGRDLISWGSGWSPTGARQGDGVVFVGTRQGEILALDTERAQDTRKDAEGRVLLVDILLWRFALEEGHTVFGMPAVGEELVYVGDRGDRDGENARLYALTKDGLEQEWSTPIAGGIVGGPTLAEEEGLVLVGSDDGHLYAFYTRGDAPDEPKGATDAARRESHIPGDEAWRFPTGGQVWSAPTLAGGVVYFGSMDRHIYAVSLDSGTELWKYKTGGAVVGKPLLTDGKIIVRLLRQEAVRIGLEKREAVVDLPRRRLVLGRAGHGWRRHLRPFHEWHGVCAECQG